MELNEKNIWALLQTVPDPEIPVISVVELGVVRKVDIEGEQITITITPTYSGCPAMKTFEVDILQKLAANNFHQVEIKTVHHPAWTTDWINDTAKEKLRKFGIAPPEGTASKKALLGEPDQVTCPRCGSKNTKMISQFGSTACKALWKCDDCLETFDYFKCI